MRSRPATVEPTVELVTTEVAEPVRGSPDSTPPAHQIRLTLQSERHVLQVRQDSSRELRTSGRPQPLREVHLAGSSHPVVAHLRSHDAHELGTAVVDEN